MEIRLDDVSTAIHVEKMRTNASELILVGTTTEVSSQSEAVEKFLSSYEMFLEALKEYQSILRSDVQSISTIVTQWRVRDMTQSELFTLPQNSKK